MSDEAKPVPEEQVNNQPFHEAALQDMREASRNVLLKYPEVRSVIVVFDYAGNLNDTINHKGLWMSVEGSNKTPASCVGTAVNMLKVLEVVQREHVVVQSGLNALLLQTARDLNAKYKELHGTDAPKPAQS